MTPSCGLPKGSPFFAPRAQKSAHLLAGGSPVAGGAKPPAAGSLGTEKSARRSASTKAPVGDRASNMPGRNMK